MLKMIIQLERLVVINTTCIGLSSTIQTVTLYTFSLLAELHSYAYTSHFSIVHVHKIMYVNKSIEETLELSILQSLLKNQNII